MTDELTALLSELPNCRVHIRGTHCYTDKYLYSNLYGESFFSPADEDISNPYVADRFRDSGGVLEDYLGEHLPIRSLYQPAEPETAKGVLSVIDPRYLSGDESDKKTDHFRRTMNCVADGYILDEGDGTLSLRYGGMGGVALYLTGKCLTFTTDSAPLPVICIDGEARTYQSCDYPVGDGSEFLAIDYTVKGRIRQNTLTDQGGRLVFEYAVEIANIRTEYNRVEIRVIPDN